MDPLQDWTIVNNEATSTLKGHKLHASDFAYVPDPDKPSTWKLRIDDAHHVSAAIAALGKGFRGKKVQIPAEHLAAVKAKVAAAHKKFFGKTHNTQVQNTGWTEAAREAARLARRAHEHGRGDNTLKALMESERANQISKGAEDERDHEVAASQHFLARNLHEAAAENLPSGHKAKSYHQRAAAEHHKAAGRHVDAMVNNKSTPTTNSKKKALYHSHKAMQASMKATDHPDFTTDAHLYSEVADKMDMPEHHTRAAMAHGDAAKAHVDLGESCPQEYAIHQEAANQHKQAQTYHMELSNQPPTTTYDVHNEETMTTENKLHSNMTEDELRDSVNAGIAELKKRQDKKLMDGFMGLTFENENAEDSPSAKEGTEYLTERPQDMDLTEEFAGVGLAHNLTANDLHEAGFTAGEIENLLGPAPQQTANAGKSVMEQLFASTNPKDQPYKEIFRDAIHNSNQERGQLLVALTANMNDQQKHFFIRKYQNAPMSELRMLFGAFVGNQQSQAVPQLLPIYPGAGGGGGAPLNTNGLGNLTNNWQNPSAEPQAFGQEANLSVPSTDWKGLAKEQQESVA